MSKPKLDTANLMNELKDSSFFKPSTPLPVVSSPTPKKVIAIKTPQKQAQKPPSEVTSYNDSELASMLERIRKTVKDQGNKVSFARITDEEKNKLMDIIYTYKRLGIKTTENEVVRIAINYLIEDYQANGKTSVLATVLDMLRA